MCFLFLKDNPYDKVRLSTDIVYSIFEDKSGILWIGTAGDGVNKLDFRKLQFVYYSYQPDNKRSLSNNKGFCIFKPDNIKDDKLLPPVVLTNFMIFNETVPIGKKVMGEFVLNKSITEIDQLTLSYKHSVITFEFAALHYASSRGNKYAYYMQGLKSEWNYVGNRRFATYVNLPPGQYIFRVKAANISGLWNEKGIALKITVIPPIWQTWYFRITTGIILILIIFIGYKARVRNIEKREKQLEVLNNQLTLENKERRRSEEEVKKYAEELKQLNATKDKFFSIIAHDLKNPFNAIINSTKLMARDFDNFHRNDHLRFLDLISKSSEAAYNLLENLLLWARSQRGKIEIDSKYFDLSNSVKECIDILNQPGCGKKYCYKINNKRKYECICRLLYCEYCHKKYTVQCN